MKNSSSQPFVVLVCVFTLSMSAIASSQDLFPQPFLVEHQVVQTDSTGDASIIGPVVDYYGGSWIISTRSDGGRTILDLASHEMTVIDAGKSTYSVLSFARFGELRRRLQVAERGGPEMIEPQPEKAAVELVVSDVGAQAAMRGAAKSGPLTESRALDRAGVRRMRVTAKRADRIAATVDVWLDPEITLSRAGLDALHVFERTVLGDPNAAEGATFNEMIAAARLKGNGAVVLRSVRPMVFDQPEDTGGSVEDVALRIEKLAVLPPDLLVVPEGFRRAPHPLEHMVAFIEQENELRRQMSAPIED